MDRKPKSKKWRWVLIGTAALTVLIWVSLRPDPSLNPVVDGRRLSDWMESCADAYYYPSRSLDEFPKYAAVFRKAGEPGIRFLEQKLIEKSAIRTKYVQLKSSSPGWLFKVLPTVRPGDWAQKECAAILLGEIGVPASNSVAALVLSLDFTEVHETDKSTGASNGKSFSPILRAQAIRSLAKIAPDSPMVIDALIEALKQKYVWVPAATPGTKTSVATYATEALAGLSPEFKVKIPRMIANLRYQDQKQFRGPAIAMVYAAGSLAPGSGETVARLIPVLKDLDPEARDAAAYDLGVIRLGKRELAQTALPALTEALNDSDASVRIRVVETVLLIDPKQSEPVLPTLVNLLADSNYVVRLRAIDSIRQIGPDARIAIPTLAKSLSDESATVWTWVSEALNTVGWDAENKTRK